MTITAVLVLLLSFRTCSSAFVPTIDSASIGDSLQPFDQQESGKELDDLVQDEEYHKEHDDDDEEFEEDRDKNVIVEDATFAQKLMVFLFVVTSAFVILIYNMVREIARQEQNESLFMRTRTARSQRSSVHRSESSLL